jgi:hypothetical protein
MTEPPTMNAKEFLDALKKESEKTVTLTEDQLRDHAIAGLNSMRGIARNDKLKVLRRMRKLMDA